MLGPCGLGTDTLPCPELTTYDSVTQTHLSEDWAQRLLLPGSNRDSDRPDSAQNSEMWIDSECWSFQLTIKSLLLAMSQSFPPRSCNPRMWRNRHCLNECDPKQTTVKVPPVTWVTRPQASQQRLPQQIKGATIFKHKICQVLWGGFESLFKSAAFSER